MIISQVKPGSPAEAGGVKVGDQVLEMNGAAMTGMTQFKVGTDCVGHADSAPQVVAMVRQAKEALSLVLTKPTADVSGAVNVAPGTPERTRRAAENMRKMVRQEVGAVTGSNLKTAAPKAAALPKPVASKPAASKPAEPSAAAPAKAAVVKPAAAPTASTTPATSAADPMQQRLTDVISRIETAASKLGLLSPSELTGSAESRLAAILSKLEGQSGQCAAAVP